jgi:hypothetical protein
VAVLLAACGGSNDTPMPARTTTDVVPVMRSPTSGGHATYRAEWSEASSEDEEPMDVSMLILPQSEDTEPVSVQ